MRLQVVGEHDARIRKTAEAAGYSRAFSLRSASRGDYAWPRVDLYRRDSIPRALLKARAKGKTLPPFRYRDYGALATIGRKRAIFERGRLKFTGLFAWLSWSMAHIYFLIGFRNRLVVAMSWAWSYVTFQRGTRLITGGAGQRPAVTVGGDAATTTRQADDNRFKGAA